MKINLAKSAGFCFGVRRALQIALETAASNKKVCMLGDIVHNEAVARQIKNTGIKKIKKMSAGIGKVFLIRAHGTCLETEKRARKLGYAVIDATCPMVKEIHRIVRDMERKGYEIIIIGDKGHDEVHGVIGQLDKKALVIDTAKHIPWRKIKQAKKTCVVAQSTQNIDKVIEIVRILKSRIKELKFFNTICVPTRIKQQEIKKMPLSNDAMLIIGSKMSANTKRLYQISKSLNKKTYWISTKKEIRPHWFKNVQKIGVAAGASTPDFITQDIINYLKNLA